VGLAGAAVAYRFIVGSGPVAAAEVFKVTHTDEEWQKLIQRIPLKRPARIEEIASALEFLLKNEYITGQTIVVDGGYSLV